MVDEFTGDPRQFQERHYSEFVTFLSYAQRFLYGEGKRTGSDFQEDSAIRGFHRDDITKVRMIFPGPNTAPATFTVAHVDLYFFYDIDVAILVVEIYADDVLLWQVQNSPFALADAIPSTWEPDGHDGHYPKHVEYLSSEDKVFAVSDYDHREKYLSFVGQHRSLSLASH